MNMNNYNPFSLQGKTILITGASSGIGRATAIECSKMYATVIITGRNEERLNEAFNLLENKELKHQQIIADINNKADVDRLINDIPNLDGLVNNAGISKLQPILFLNEDDLKSMITTNTLSPVMLTKQLLKRKKINKCGSIVFTSSIAGVFKTTPGNVIYAMSKSSINAFMKSAALEMSPRLIRCNSVNPGMVETKLIKSGMCSQEDTQNDIAKYPLKRYGKPEEIAFAIIYLLSDASSWVTGHALVIDGGSTLR
jgi:NAD(P)-dependent dehydrogenase (short-subunit alcohol dehydrogenase family)